MASREDSPYSSASPPCMAHELADGQDGSFFVVDEEQRRDVARWRKSERERLIARRLAFSADDRNRWSGAIGDGVASFVGDFSGRVVSFYWPFRGEPDLRPLMHTVWEQGGEAALPIVVAKATPLVFRTWRQGEALEKGVWNIPVPSGGGSFPTSCWLPSSGSIPTAIGWVMAAGSSTGRLWAWRPCR